jgi:hypothetical protein
VAKPQEVRELYPFKRLMSHTTMAFAEAGLIALLVVGLVAGTAFAAKGGGGKPGGGGTSSSTLTMVMVDPADTSANHNDWITFTVTTTEPYPVVSATCSQGGVVVFGDSHPMYSPNIWEDPGHFKLASLSWTSGGASCTAALKGTNRGKVVTLATTSFSVEP